ncbi:unnamed protein product [Closterium sp. NIES-65]|nr:unnamed protein product [Closterium sp. NIES-65]
MFDARRLATAVPEDIVFCIDTDIEAARDLKPSTGAAAATAATAGEGVGGEAAGVGSIAQQATETAGGGAAAGGAGAAAAGATAAAGPAASLTRLDAIRQALLLFTHSKLAMNPSHRFALAALKGNTAAGAPAPPTTQGPASPHSASSASSPRQPQFSWVVEHFTNDMNSLLAGVQSLHATSAFSSVDLSPLFRALASESQRSVDRGRSLRLILFYCRSSCIPGPPPNRAPRPTIPFTADCIYWHDRPNNFNRPQEVFDGLTAALEAVSVPEPYIWENSSNSARYIFRATSSLLAHPAQRLADDYLSMPRVLDSGPRNAPPGEATASGSGASGAGASGSGAPDTGYYSGGAGGLEAVYGGNGGEKGAKISSLPPRLLHLLLPLHHSAHLVIHPIALQRPQPFSLLARQLIPRPFHLHQLYLPPRIPS